MYSFRDRQNCTAADFLNKNEAATAQAVFSYQTEKVFHTTSCMFLTSTAGATILIALEHNQNANHTEIPTGKTSQSSPPGSNETHAHMHALHIHTC